ncbi:predicted protein [Coccidioides posadasii str. Silveira]|uniref:Predicted protein n=1 Tax=Coccidioides posadasii (strain RMSCC 757 / Silveira) TaxID=443226 RepID=E9D4P3_COCPS|nr:predicted protein [Coccidioides posadasii str. Silveira]
MDAWMTAEHTIRNAPRCVVVRLPLGILREGHRRHSARGWGAVRGLVIPVAIRYQKFGRSPPTGGLAVIYVTLIVHTENPYPVRRSTAYRAANGPVNISISFNAKINSGLVVSSTTAEAHHAWRQSLAGSVNLIITTDPNPC